MKIYFAASIRAGRQDVSIYELLIGHIKQFGEVLTEHVGDYSLSKKGQNFSDQYIHDRDIEWLLNSDVVIAEVTTPSLGTGYELGVAVSNKIPTLCLFRIATDVSLSAMIWGSKWIETVNYSSIDEAINAINVFLNTQTENLVS